MPRLVGTSTQFKTTATARCGEPPPVFAANYVDYMFALCEPKEVNVISAKTIKRYAALHPEAAQELMRWNKAASAPFGGISTMSGELFPIPTNSDRC